MVVNYYWMILTGMEPNVETQIQYKNMHVLEMCMKQSVGNKQVTTGAEMMKQIEALI